MNRRGFITALAAAPVAAFVAPTVMARTATGGVIRASSFATLQSFSAAAGTIGLVGEAAGESILPMSSVPAYVVDAMRNPARQFQAIFEQSFGVSDANTAIFDANAAYCDELIEVEA